MFPLSRPATLAVSLCLLLAPGLAVAQDETALTAASRQALTLTIYNQNLGLVSETRRVDLPAGESLLAIEDVSRQMQPETVLLSAPGLRVVEQSLDADLLTQQRLLEASLGKTVLFFHNNLQGGENRVEEARLLSVTGDNVILQVGDRIQVLPVHANGPFSGIAFKEMPAGLRSEPALLARVARDKGGAADLQLEYLTSGLSWRADYVARLNAASDRLDLSALVTLTNATDADFENAALRLIAGEVNPGPVARKPAPTQAQGFAMRAVAAAPEMSAPQAAGNRYLYNVERPVSLKRGETKQIPLMSAEGVAVTREYRFENVVIGHPGADEIGPVNADLILELKNDKALGLGAPLPAGTVRVYGPAGNDAGASLFLGADTIGHTPEGEKARLSLGQAFDVTARAERSVFARLSDRSYETGQKITVKNAKAEPVQVVLAGQMPQGWTLRQESAPHEQVSANRISWRLTVPAGGETILTYRIRVSN